jgi:hypothetical protein
MRKFLLTLLVLIAAVGVRAEEPLATKIHDAIRSAEPNWRCINGILNASLRVPSEKRLVETSCDYTSGTGTRKDINMDIVQVDSVADAEICLSPIREAKVAAGWKIRKIELGDEGYLATYRNGSRFEIHFRKGTIVVIVSSNSLQDANRFVQHITDQL